MTSTIIARAYRGRNAKMAFPGGYLEIAREEYYFNNPLRFADLLEGLGITEEFRLIPTAPRPSPSSCLLGPQLVECAVNVSLCVSCVGSKALGPVTVKEEAHNICISIPHQEPELALQVGLWVIKRLNALLAPSDSPDSDDDSSPAAEKSALLAMSRMLSAFPTIDALVHVALLRSIPVMRCDRWPFVAQDGLEVPETQAGVLVLGQGRKQRRLVHSCIIPVSPEIAKVLSDGFAVNQRLAQAGIPVPRTAPEFRNILSLTRALQAAEAIGYPVVLKPRFECMESTRVRPANNPAELAEQFQAAAPYRRRMIVEKYVSGHCFRFLVIGQELLAVQLISLADKDSDPLHLDVSHTVPLASIHPSVQWQAIDVVRSLSLTMAEVFMLTSDIALPLTATRGAVIGARILGDLMPYCESGETLPCYIAGKVLDQLVPDPLACRIPIIAVTGTNGKTTTCRITARILQTAGYQVGLACTDGVYVNGRLVQSGDMSGISGASLVLQQPGIDVAVLETARGGLVTKGLGFEQSEAATCTNVENDHLGQEGIETLEQMAELKRLVVESARRWVVLNARDPRCLDMAAHLPGRTMCLVAPSFTSEEMADYLARGYHLVGTIIRDGIRHLGHWQATSYTDYGDVRTIPLTFEGLAEHNIQNIMHAIGLTLGVGVSAKFICSTLSQIMPGALETPGRLNWYGNLPFPVILDFAHNPHGLTSLCRFVDKIKRQPDSRRILVFAPRERWAVAQLQDAASIVSSSFDVIVARDRKNLEITAPGQVAKALVNALLQQGFHSDQAIAIPDYREAILFALQLCHSGDLLVIGTWCDHEDIWLLLDEYARDQGNGNHSRDSNRYT